MATIDLYNILDLQRDCDQNDIKKAYNNLAKIYHPDKVTGNAEMFELIKHAYEILYDDEKRKEYDNLFEMSKYCNTDHYDLKKQSEDYYQNIVKSPNDLEKKKKEYNQYCQECDDKTLDQYDNDELTQEEFDKKINAKKLAREQDDCECMPDKLFEDKIDMKKFNSIFTKSYKNELVVKQDFPSPWMQSESFGDFEVQPFQEHISYDAFIQNSNIESTDLDLNVNIADKLAERQRETENLKNIKMTDFKKDYYGYGIYDNLGVTDDMFNNLSTQDIKMRYERLLKSKKS